MQQLNTQNLIIGFGKAGKTLAADLAKHGQQVILAEASEQMYGGTCINIGCIPSKKLLVEGEQNAAIADKNHVFQQAMQAKNSLVTKLRAANFSKLDALDNVQIITAKARFEDQNTVLLSGRDGEFRVTAERIFINTGSLPVELNIPGADGKQIYNSTGILSLNTHPKRLVIIGCGYISLEFAFMYHQFGAKVTIIDSGNTFLPREDRDIADEMTRVLQARGVDIILGADVKRFEQHSNKTQVITSQGTFSADAVLLAVGRRPNTDGLALENAGIGLTERGFIKINSQLQAAPHIWAMGDVAGSPQFTYISLDDYRIVREQLLGEGKRNTQDRPHFPTTVFTEPPLAQIGMTESQAAKSGRPYRVATLRAEAIPKAKILNQTDGLLKAIIDSDNNQILGVTLFCAEAHEIINLFKMAMDHHIPADYLKNQIFTHPTISEGLNDLFA
ncbi:FAD-dependent oxidoreductase [Testudinibacter aquarius]|uniref:Pyruvate/2-oxoglutarate dehydrogenase complex dihydrolipoamide dehydrogenase (E3) component n=1 Tax=Testudinibacter aquarius TaxID=1524974 RepID=A0A4R3Y901_9PAST|nr:FAD-dependent oxidoreductase [Testudinibacter aquarius]KAE9528327.1 pyridine nucleotide-disulfide oxidoreductase [Testudinibacter aquarius]TCV88835.1 pyruvate/2-oxoglutarate dehydrogenase complex dihydrolipoamide dehydrogenase (E3) component [Testudinibacter aquarius]